MPRLTRTHSRCLTAFSLHRQQRSLKDGGPSVRPLVWAIHPIIPALAFHRIQAFTGSSGSCSIAVSVSPSLFLHPKFAYLSPFVRFSILPSLLPTAPRRGRSIVRNVCSAISKQSAQEDRGSESARAGAGGDPLQMRSLKSGQRERRERK